jgi:hypothetical protein
VVPFLEQLHQLTGVGMILAGGEQADVVFNTDTANVMDQDVVGRTVLEPASGGRQVVWMQPRCIPDRLRRRHTAVRLATQIRHVFRGTVVARYALTVQHRLDLALEIKAARWAMPGSQRFRCAVGRQGRTERTDVPWAFRGNRRTKHARRASR